ncbi:MAG: iron-containing alcohol dehydrogenase [Pseudomonadota bacterium]
MSLITYLTRIHFADGVLDDALAEEMRNLGIVRPLLITDRAGEADTVFEPLSDALPGQATPIRIHQRADVVTREAAEQAQESYRVQGCDGIIGFGGASALGLARLTGAGIDPAAPVITIPTTLGGIGLEPLGLPHQTSVSQRSRRRRIPSAILCDPSLVQTGEPASAAAAGIDILSHCVEAFLGTTFNPPADGMALEGARRAFGNIERAVEDQSDRAARRELMAASVCAGLAAEKGLGGLEALSCAFELESGCREQHGHFHAALLKPVLGFNKPAVGGRFEVIRGAIGLPPKTDLPDALADMASSLGLPERLGAASSCTEKLTPSVLERAADHAAAHAANRTNPRHATARDYLSLLETAI